MRNAASVALLFLTLATAVGYSDESSEDKAASWEPMIVLSGNAQVFAGDKPGPKIPPGTIVFISQRNKDWLLVPRYNNWLHEQHVRSLPTALAYLNEQIKKEPTGPLHHYRAIVLSELGRAEEAVQDFNAAIAAGTDSSNVFLNRGLAWGRAGNRENALSDFAIAIERDAKNAQAYFNRGVLTSQSGNHAASLDDFNHAIEVDPQYAEAFNNRGVAQQALGRLDLARADYDRAVALRPRYPGALTNRAYLHQLDGDYTAAIADYAAALRMAPDSHPTLNDLAWLLATCPDKDIRNAKAALEYAQRAVQLTGEQDADYLDTLAAAAAAAGDFDLATKTAEAAIKLTPEDARTELQSRLDLYRKQEPFVEAQPKPAQDDAKKAAKDAKS